MSHIKSLADQLRSTLKEPAKKTGKANSSHAPPGIPAILEAIRAYDNSSHKSMVHARFSEKSLQTMNQLKMATGVDVSRLVCFSVDFLFSQHPELKTLIKQFFQNLDE